MECFICDQDATLSQSFSDSTKVVCDDCGEYAIDGMTVRQMNAYAKHLHTIETRQWLDARRAEGSKVPFIDASVVVWD